MKVEIDDRTLSLVCVIAGKTGATVTEQVEGALMSMVEDWLRDSPPPPFVTSSRTGSGEKGKS